MNNTYNNDNYNSNLAYSVSWDHLGFSLDLNSQTAYIRIIKENYT